MSEPYKIESYTLADGAGEPLFFAGFFFRILECSGASALDVSVDDYDTYSVPVGVGIPVPGGFSKMRVENHSGGPVTFTIGVGNGPIDDGRFTSSGTVNVSGDVNATEVIATTVPTTADKSVAATTKASVLAANASRKRVFVKALKANGGAVRVGDTNTGATRGVELQPGEGVDLPTTAEIFVYNTHTAACSVSLAEAV